MTLKEISSRTFANHWKRKSPHDRFPPLTRLVVLKWRQFQVETLGGYRFRGQERDFVRRAYDGMGQDTFEVINGAQEWLNWRQIPMALRKRVPEEAALVLDLGCGPGSSTRILAWHGMPTWRILGMDFSEDLIRQARRSVEAGDFCTASGKQPIVEFVVGSVLEPFHDASGTLLADHTVDYVNSSGIVGHHLSAEGFTSLAAELRRVVKPHGFVALDSGPHLKEAVIRRTMERFGFVLRTKVRSVPLDPRPQLVFQSAGGQEPHA